jgi:hypothetical protein
MIGIVVQPQEREAVAELFELCKTPWEFCRPGAAYDVLLCTFVPEPVPAAARVLIVYAAASTPLDPAGTVVARPPDDARLIRHANRPIPLYGALATFPTSQHDLVLEPSSREPVLRVWRQDGQTVIRVGYNLLTELHHLLTAGQPVPQAEHPALEAHLALLRDLITRAGLPLVEIPPVPAGHPFVACLTHDVDHPILRNHLGDHTMFGFLFRATVGTLLQVIRGRLPARRMWRNWLAALKLPGVYLGVCRDFWSDFDQAYLRLEAGRPSTYFVIPRRDHPGLKSDGSTAPMRASRYEVSELTSQLDRVTAAGCEVSLHGLDAWRDATEGRKERALLQGVIKQAERGVRMHWLYFSSASPSILEAAGFSYDSTVGYNETVGYRAGATQVYRPLGCATLLELPLHLMDTALFYPDYLNLTEDQARQRLARMIGNVAEHGGALTVNWHDRSFAPERLWGDFYQKMLAELQTHAPWFATAAQTVAWFRMRRSACFESVAWESGAAKVRCRLTALDTTLPGLRIRVHKPHALNPAELLAAGSPGGFVDTPLPDSMHLSIAL